VFINSFWYDSPVWKEIIPEVIVGRFRPLYCLPKTSVKLMLSHQNPKNKNDEKTLNA
jgi:hypothetical protein